jgi:hypothetical protein
MIDVAARPSPTTTTQLAWMNIVRWQDSLSCAYLIKRYLPFAAWRLLNAEAMRFDKRMKRHK